MPNDLFVLNDERKHGFLGDGQERELCELSPLPRGGDFFVLAKGELHGIHLSFTVRLTVFAFGGAILAQDKHDFWSTEDVSSGTLALSVAARVPHEGGAGSAGAPVPPEPRIGLSVFASLGSGYGTVSNITIAAFALDHLIETTIPPDPLFADTAAELLMRMHGPDPNPR